MVGGYWPDSWLGPQARISKAFLGQALMLHLSGRAARDCELVISANGGVVKTAMLGQDNEVNIEFPPPKDMPLLLQFSSSITDSAGANCPSAYRVRICSRSATLDEDMLATRLFALINVAISQDGARLSRRIRDQGKAMRVDQINLIELELLGLTMSGRTRCSILRPKPGRGFVSSGRPQGSSQFSHRCAPPRDDLMSPTPCALPLSLELRNIRDCFDASTERTEPVPFH
jgi:hypothetical protein